MKNSKIFEEYMALATEVFLYKEKLPIHIDAVVRERLVTLWSVMSTGEQIQAEPMKIAIEPLTN